MRGNAKFLKVQICSTWPLRTQSWSLTISRFGNHSIILEYFSPFPNALCHCQGFFGNDIIGPEESCVRVLPKVGCTRGRRSINLYELQSLTGYLAFCVKVILIGRGFFRCLYHATTPGTGPRSQPIPSPRECCWIFIGGRNFFQSVMEYPLSIQTESFDTYGPTSPVQKDRAPLQNLASTTSRSPGRIPSHSLSPVTTEPKI